MRDIQIFYVLYFTTAIIQVAVYYVFYRSKQHGRVYLSMWYKWLRLFIYVSWFICLVFLIGDIYDISNQDVIDGVVFFFIGKGKLSQLSNSIPTRLLC